MAPPSASIVNRVRDGLRPGSIVLMHVASFSSDAAALPAVIAGDPQPRLLLRHLAALELKQRPAQQPTGTAPK